jgi:RimJ/RimL family protein N-acetyltransferase
MREHSSPDCVGAFVRDGHNRVYAHRRTNDRRVLPGIWDVVGGHVEPGETAEQALAREIEEETGWRLRHIEAVIADWEWEYDGVVRRELDYLVEVDGDLSQPRLEEGKHDAYAWVGPDNLEQMMVGRTDGDRRLRDIVAKATRIRLTERLQLEPIGPEHAGDLFRVHSNPGVAAWYGELSRADIDRLAVDMGAAWEQAGVSKWIVYLRSTGELVGRGGLSRMTPDQKMTDQIRTALGPGSSWADTRLELGWALIDDHWGHGYATEIGQAGLDYGFDPLGGSEVVAFTEVHNTKSSAVMERLGMEPAGEITAAGPIAGLSVAHDDAPFVLYTKRRSS